MTTTNTAKLTAAQAAGLAKLSAAGELRTMSGKRSSLPGFLNDRTAHSLIRLGLAVSVDNGWRVRAA